MSAYMVDRDVIEYLVDMAQEISTVSPAKHHSYGVFSWWHIDKWRKLTRGDAEACTRIGQMLWDENRASIEYRYPDTVGDDANKPGTCDDGACGFKYHHKPTAIVRGTDARDMAQLIQTCKHFDYQACEHPDYRSSEAHAFVQALMNEARDRLAFLAMDGDDPEWGAPPRPSDGPVSLSAMLNV